MAGAKETPRNKLIALMYLVFITMLALNVSKEVLDGFGQIFKKIQSANERLKVGNEVYYDKIATNSEEKGGKWITHDKAAKEVKDHANRFFDYIEDIKQSITEKQRIDDPNLDNYGQMDKGEALDLIFFDADGTSPGGEDFITQIHDFEATLVRVFASRFPQYKHLIEERFQTGDFENNIINADGQSQSWLSHNYEGFPLISSLAKLTMLQNDVRLTESDVLNSLLGKELEANASVNESNYLSMLNSEKSVYYPGEMFNGRVILGRKGGAQNPNDIDLSIDGVPISDDQYEKIPGGIKLNVMATSPGDHKITGNLVFLNDGVESMIPVDQTFTVISKPNSAVISADKMNVVYRGVENPITVSIPGVPNSKINAKASGLKKVSGSKYNMVPGRGSNVTIDAQGELPDGSIVSSKSIFRIKDLPKPRGKFRGKYEETTIPKGSLARAIISADFGEDFDFELPLEIKEFRVQVPGKAFITCTGNKLSNQALNAVRGLPSGSFFTITGITVVAPINPNLKFRKVSPVNVTVKN